MENFQFLLILIIYFTCFTISQYLSVCSAILAKFIDYCISLIIYYNLKMHCHCHKRSLNTDKIKQQEQAITLLQEFIDKEKQVHLQEIRVINESLEEFARDKESQVQQFQEYILKLGKKLDQYKQKNTNLNQKLKENANTIKALMEKKLHLQAQIIASKDQIDRQRKRQLQEARVISEMKQIVTLQEIQNKQLSKQNARLHQEIVYLQKQIANYSQVKDKFSNIEQISEQQYQKQISLLRNELQHQFSKKTNDIFNSMTKQLILEDRDMNMQVTNYKMQIIQKEQLKKLANYTDYGKTYFSLQNNDLSLEASNKIFAFISKMATSLEEIQYLLAQQRQISCNLAKDLREKIYYFDDEIKKVSQIKTQNKQTQTYQSGKIEQVINANHNLKIKIYSLSKIITFLSKFSIHLLRIISIQTTKNKYYHFTQALVYPCKPKRPKFRSVCFSILFTIILRKSVNKLKRITVDERFDRANLQKHLNGNYLCNLLYSFALKQKRRIGIKNNKIEEIVSERSQINPNQKIIEILNQQYLNQGPIPFNYSQLFSKFIYSIQAKMQTS